MKISIRDLLREVELKKGRRVKLYIGGEYDDSLGYFPKGSDGDLWIKTSDSYDYSALFYKQGRFTRWIKQKEFDKKMTPEKIIRWLGWNSIEGREYSNDIKDYDVIKQ